MPQGKKIVQPLDLQLIISDVVILAFSGEGFSAVLGMLMAWQGISSAELINPMDSRERTRKRIALLRLVHN